MRIQAILQVSKSALACRDLAIKVSYDTSSLLCLAGPGGRVKLEALGEAVYDHPFT